MNYVSKMENEFKKILTFLEKLNDNAQKKIISSSELQEEHNNIKDLNWLNNETLKHVDLLKKANPSSIDDIMGQICYLNVKLNTYIWHIESMRDITEKFIMKDSKND
ncbi:MAG TPA: hypothetical protein VLB80_03350 [Candidatus Babeliales bacterium]|nr:hypothetical protein [Candidatus Babeliales bacterium]